MRPTFFLWRKTRRKHTRAEREVLSALDPPLSRFARREVGFLFAHRLGGHRPRRTPLVRWSRPREGALSPSAITRCVTFLSLSAMLNTGKEGGTMTIGGNLKKLRVAQALPRTSWQRSCTSPGRRCPTGSGTCPTQTWTSWRPSRPSWGVEVTTLLYGPPQPYRPSRKRVGVTVGWQRQR